MGKRIQASGGYSNRIRWLFAQAWLITIPIFANSTGIDWWGGIEGGTVIAEPPTSASLERETVHLIFGQSLQEVHAQFEMMNLGDRPLELLTGFPFEYPEYEADELTTTLQRNFKATAERSPNLHHHRSDGWSLEYGLTASLPVAVDPGDGPWPFQESVGPDVLTARLARRWAYYILHFEARETLYHSVSYRLPVFEGDQKGWAGSYMIYIARSGATWSTPIKQATFVVHFPSFDPDMIHFYPKGYQLDKTTRTATWIFEDWIPDTDFYIGTPSYESFEYLDRCRKMDWDRTFLREQKKNESQ